MIGFPLIIADSVQDMPGFKPGPARLAQQGFTNLTIRERARKKET